MSASPVDRDLPETTPAAARAPRRHSAEVTADRLQEHLVTFADYLTPVERASMNRTIGALYSIPDRVRVGGDDQ